MKCPKCGYIGFETTDRCKNCGYEFALASAAPPPAELPIQVADDHGGPLRDLALQPTSDTSRKTGLPLDLDRLIGVERTDDLPLFAGSAPDDLPPLVTPPATPRRPLAVRRPTPDPSRLRARSRQELRSTPAPSLLPPDQPAERPPQAPTSHAPVPTAIAHPRDDVAMAAPSVARLGAALLDLALMLGIDAVTLYFTLRLCDLTLAGWRLLPVLPLLAFFLLIAVGYLSAFTTAGGQTIGKMAFGLKVVGASGAPVPFPASALRALGSIASTLCFGLGLVPALTGSGGMAVHDRLARTRVVRVDG